MMMLLSCHGIWSVKHRMVVRLLIGRFSVNF